MRDYLLITSSIFNQDLLPNKSKASKVLIKPNKTRIIRSQKHCNHIIHTSNCYLNQRVHRTISRRNSAKRKSLPKVMELKQFDIDVCANRLKSIFDIQVEQPFELPKDVMVKKVDKCEMAQKKMSVTDELSDEIIRNREVELNKRFEVLNLRSGSVLSRLKNRLSLSPKSVSKKTSFFRSSSVPKSPVNSPTKGKKKRISFGSKWLPYKSDSR